MTILTYELRFPRASQQAFILGVFGLMRRQDPDGMAGIALGDIASPVDPPVYLQANVAHLGGRLGQQSRWVAQCDDCGGGEYVSLAEPVFMCCHCWNRAVGHQWRNVVFRLDPLAVEVELEKRPMRYRNWLPEETITQLQEQTAVITKTGER